MQCIDACHSYFSETLSLTMDSSDNVVSLVGSLAVEADKAKIAGGRRSVGSCNCDQV